MFQIRWGKMKFPQGFERISVGEGPHHSEIQKLNRYNVIDSLEIPDMSHRSTALLCWDYESFHDLAEEC